MRTSQWAFVLFITQFFISCNNSSPNPNPTPPEPILLTGTTYKLVSVSDVDTVHTMPELSQSYNYINVEPTRRPWHFTCQTNAQLPGNMPGAGVPMDTRRVINLRIVSSAADADSLNAPRILTHGISLGALEVLQTIIQGRADSLCLGIRFTTQVDISFANALSTLNNTATDSELSQTFRSNVNNDEITVILSQVYLPIFYASIEYKFITITRVGFLNPTMALHEIGHILGTAHPVCNCNLCRDMTSHFMYPRLRTSSFRPAQVMIQDWLAIIQACGTAATLCSVCPGTCEITDSEGSCWECPPPSSIAALVSDTTGIYAASVGEFRYYTKPQLGAAGAEQYARWQSRIVMEFFEGKYFAFIVNNFHSNQSIDTVPTNFHLSKFNIPGLFQKINSKLTDAQVDMLANEAFMN